MPFNGSGVFSIVNTFVPGTTIFSSAVNANYSDIANGLSTAILKDGTQTVTANIPMAGKKFTNLAVGSAAADSVRYDQVSSIPGFVNGPGYLNIARRNGGLEIWQRGAGGAAAIAVGASTTAYTADGWYLMTNANQASTVAQLAGITDGSQWSLAAVRNSGQTGTGVMNLGFPLDTDELYPALGQYVRLSLTLAAGANWSPTSGNMTIIVATGTGSPVKATAGYTGQVNVISVTQAITSSATRYQFASSVVVPTNTRQMEITLQWIPVGTAGVIDGFLLDDVQLEIVPNTTQTSAPFERLNFEEQLLLCQRHFFKTFTYATAPATAVGLGKGEFSFSQTVAAAATMSGMEIRFPVPMRIAPALTAYNPVSANAIARDITTNSDWTSTTLGGSPSVNAMQFSGAAVAGSAAGNHVALHIIADAGI